jgi:hypothetical protein
LQLIGVTVAANTDVPVAYVTDRPVITHAERTLPAISGRGVGVGTAAAGSGIKPAISGTPDRLSVVLGVVLRAAESAAAMLSFSVAISILSRPI